MTIPTKTALGQEELKRRTHRLGQRHRTILLLVDGRRPLAEVLGLAQQAGAATSHFEELVRLGLVELPTEPEPPAPEPPPVEEIAVAKVAMELPPPPADEAPSTAEEVVDDLAGAAPAEPVAAAATPVPTVPVVDVVDALPSVAEAVVVEPPTVAFPAAVAKPPPALAAPPARVAPPPAAIPMPPDAVAMPPIASAPPLELTVPDDANAADGLQPVRNLLMETLRLDAPLFSARMFVRVRNARTATELIDLVWEIQDRLMRVRHAKRELISLQRARELLGLGNTLVAEDSTRPPHLDE